MYTYCVHTNLCHVRLFNTWSCLFDSIMAAAKFYVIITGNYFPVIITLIGISFTFFNLSLVGKERSRVLAQEQPNNICSCCWRSRNVDQTSVAMRFHCCIRQPKYFALFLRSLKSSRKSRNSSWVGSEDQTRIYVQILSHEWSRTLIFILLLIFIWQKE